MNKGYSWCSTSARIRFPLGPKLCSAQQHSEGAHCRPLGERRSAVSRRSGALRMRREATCAMSEEILELSETTNSVEHRAIGIANRVELRCAHVALCRG